MKKEKKNPEIDSIVASRRQRIHGFPNINKTKPIEAVK